MDSFQIISDNLTEKEKNYFLTKIVNVIQQKKPRSILLVPPDITRLDGRLGELTTLLYDKLRENYFLAVLPAIGLHRKMTLAEKEIMFGSAFEQMNFLDHDPYHQCATLGIYQWEELKKLLPEKLKGLIRLPAFPIKVSQHLLDFDLVLSLGQVVPHEVLGVSNYTKNIIIGLGGEAIINQTHWLSSLIGIENILLKISNPIREIINAIYLKHLKPKNSNIYFLYTVTRKEVNENKLKGLFFGSEKKTFLEAAKLTLKENCRVIHSPLKKVYAWMPAVKYHYTWLCNKAIYRLREIIKPGGELIIIALGVKAFSPQPIDNELIKRIGYQKKAKIIEEFENFTSSKKTNEGNLLAVLAHLIHGGDIDFKVTYVPHHELSQKSLLKAGYDFLPTEWGENFYQKNQNLFQSNLVKNGVGYFFDPGLQAFRLDNK